MKKLSLLLLLVSNIAFAFNAGLISDFKLKLDKIMKMSYGEVVSLDCGDNINTNGIICAANIKLIDTVSNRNPNGGSEELCTEVYTYSTDHKLNTVCSTCEYSEKYDFHKNKCSIEQNRTEPEIKTPQAQHFQKVVTLLNRAQHFGYLETYQTPIFMAAAHSVKEGYLEIYKLNYTFIIWDEDENGPFAASDETAKCEYIIYDHETDEYSLTDVTCDRPYTDVLDEKLIDEL